MSRSPTDEFRRPLRSVPFVIGHIWGLPAEELLMPVLYPGGCSG